MDPDGRTGRMPVVTESPRAQRGRLVDDVPEKGEAFHQLVGLQGARVEHIVSSDLPDPTEQVQGWDEWVIVLAGSADVDVAGERVTLHELDWLLIPAGTRHRVLATTQGTQWLAVHGAPGGVPLVEPGRPGQG